MSADNEKRPGSADTPRGRTQEDQTPMPAKHPSRAAERGHRIKEARKRAGLTQQQLADQVGVGRVAIARVETGTRNPSKLLERAIARELGESVQALFGGGR
jgi:putative transcriptional regulator